MVLMFCEKYRIMKDADLECWTCEFNIMNGGTCYPWRNLSESETEEAE